MRLPPNARRLFDLRREGRIPVPGPFGHVVVLPDWNMEVTGAFVVAPPDLDPTDFDFCFVGGLEVAIFTRLGDVRRPMNSWLDDVVVAVMRSDPACVTVIDLDQADAGFDLGIVVNYERIGDD